MVLFELPDKYRGQRVSSNDQGLAHQSITMIDHRGQAATKESNVECHMYEEQLGDCLSHRKTNEHFTDLIIIKHYFFKILMQILEFSTLRKISVITVVTKIELNLINCS